MEHGGYVFALCVGVGLKLGAQSFDNRHNRSAEHNIQRGAQFQELSDFQGSLQMSC